MGSVYNRGSPERPNIWIKYSDASGTVRREPIGRVNPTGLTKREVAAKERDLRHLAQARLTELEAVNLGLASPSPERPVLPTFKVAALEWADRRAKEIDSQGRPVYRDAKHERQRIERHLLQHLGHLRLDEVTPKELKRLISAKRRTLSGATVKLLLMTVSRFYNDTIEDGADVVNPVSRLDRATRRKARSTHNPDDTPFLESKATIRAVYLALPEHIRPMFAVGVFGGLRTSEVLALQWGDVDLHHRRITVRRQKTTGKKTGPLKNSRTRVVPINDSLLEVLTAWKVRCKPGLWCFPSTKTGSMWGDHIMGEELRAALTALGLDRITWYQATRHSFASHWVRDGGSFEKLCKVLGHCSVIVTERYAHLRPDAFNDQDHRTACVDLSEGSVTELGTNWAQQGLRRGGRGA